MRANWLDVAVCASRPSSDLANILEVLAKVLRERIGSALKPDKVLMYSMRLYYSFVGCPLGTSSLFLGRGLGEERAHLCHTTRVDLF
jgi:hypothetical protein